ncbi:hypothetical protein ACJQWK_11925 [Exserohilum turcicum]
MKFQAIILFFAATAFAGQCRSRGEKFTQSHAELPEATDKNNVFSYCPNAVGCCTDGSVWYACKTSCPAGAACSGSC